MCRCSLRCFVIGSLVHVGSQGSSGSDDERTAGCCRETTGLPSGDQGRSRESKEGRQKCDRILDLSSHERVNWTGSNHLVFIKLSSYALTKNITCSQCSCCRQCHVARACRAVLSRATYYFLAELPCELFAECPDAGKTPASYSLEHTTMR